MAPSSILPVMSVSEKSMPPRPFVPAENSGLEGVGRYNLSMRFNYINSMMQRMNRAAGDDVLDGILVLEDGVHAELIQAGVTYKSL